MFSNASASPSVTFIFINVSSNSVDGTAFNIAATAATAKTNSSASTNGPSTSFADKKDSFAETLYSSLFR